jgi:hypothetical protein
MAQPHRILTKTKLRLVWIISGVTGLSALSLLLFPSVLWSLFMGPATFFPQQIYSMKSPDKKYEIKVSRKVNFPALEFLDPEITVYVSLEDAEKNYQINSVEFKIREISDLENPEIIWTPDEVRINRIDSGENFSIRFRLPPDGRN